MVGRAGWFRVRRSAQAVPWRGISTVVLLVAAIIIGGLGWITAMQAAQTEPLVIAARPIAPGTRIQAEDLTVIQLGRMEPGLLQGVGDPTMLVGSYARVQLSADQPVRAELVQTAPLEQHVYQNGDLPAELLTDVVFELDRVRLSHLTSQDAVNILAVLDTSRGNDPAMAVHTMDVAGSGPRVVRVLRNLNILHVTATTAFLDVTPDQSSYLWALTAQGVRFVGEVVTDADAPLGPVTAAEMDLLQMDALLMTDAAGDDTGDGGDGSSPASGRMQ